MNKPPAFYFKLIAFLLVSFFGTNSIWLPAIQHGNYGLVFSALSTALLTGVAYALDPNYKGPDRDAIHDAFATIERQAEPIVAKLADEEVDRLSDALAAKVKR